MAAPIELEGRNLGEKHKHFNQLVKEATATQTYKIDEFNVEEGDIKNLLKIDVANKKRDVNYILKVLLNLKDTTRAEKFYEYEKSPEKAVYWLPHCSAEFILQHFAKHIDHLKISLIQRLCQKNILVLETFVDAYSPIPKRTNI
ncbi:jg9546 [Pararge aegeria aegeria]|uniref:Jg9546 protein n=1 Tax=Pararge aegeria aegeria TaxID=348720 RepID=A0A8S4RI18_9NEOP|nr:jg9546 [Pararge aegeria aegeria]